MKKLIERIIPEHKTEDCEYYCDACGRKIDTYTNMWTIDEAHCYFKTTESYEAGSGNCVTWCFDFCFECMKNKIAPELAKIVGKSMREEQYNW